MVLVFFGPLGDPAHKGDARQKPLKLEGAAKTRCLCRPLGNGLQVQGDLFVRQGGHTIKLVWWHDAGRHLFATAAGTGFMECLFNGVTGLPRALLNPANQFLGFAFGKLQIVIRELGPFLFELALRDVPVAFDFKCVHNSDYCLVVGSLG